MRKAKVKDGVREDEPAESSALRERMRTLRLSRRPIAVEFARRYRLRPRAAWRHAYGWSLKEAAERISDYAARSILLHRPARQRSLDFA